MVPNVLCIRTTDGDSIFNTDPGQAPDPLNQNLWGGTQKPVLVKALQVILMLSPG